MRLGQTSAITFSAKLGSSVISFLTIIYFSNTLGAEPLGTFFLSMAAVGWLTIPTSTSVNRALTKRMSEDGADVPLILGAALILETGLILAVTVPILLLNDWVSFYISLPDVAVVLLLMLVARSSNSFVHSAFEGQQKVHISGLLQPLTLLSERTFQVIAVLIFGLGTVGLLGGYVVGTLLVSLAASFYLSLSPLVPERYHFERILSYAKYNWVGAVESKTLSTMDTIVLGIFVTNDFIGIYNVSWNVASLLAIFGYSISEVLFPEISNLSSKGSEVSNLVTESLAYTGLFLIPGLFGSALIGDRVLEFYGPEFVDGAVVLVFLVGAQLVYSFHHQLLNAINAIDQPAIAFRVNGVFIISNITLNVILVWQFGWAGAAIATLLSAILVLALSYRTAQQLIGFGHPVHEIGKQILAAAGMTVVIYALELQFGNEVIFFRRSADTVVLAAIGAGIYFGILVLISSSIRTKLKNNLPDLG